MKQAFVLIASLVIIFSVSGCKQGKQPLRFGTDACEHCKMILMDPAFGGELITQKGKIYKFDDVNCMVAYMKSMDATREKVSETFVIDYSKPGTLIPAESAFFLRSEKVKSPMASGIAAFSTSQGRYEQQQQWQGAELNWSALKESIE